jgi:hypothetical protein
MAFSDRSEQDFTSHEWSPAGELAGSDRCAGRSGSCGDQDQPIPSLEASQIGGPSDQTFNGNVSGIRDRTSRSFAAWPVGCGPDSKIELANACLMTAAAIGLGAGGCRPDIGSRSSVPTTVSLDEYRWVSMNR